MSAIFKSEASGRAVHERYRELLKLWPVASEHLTVPTREGETFVIASGPKDAPALLLFHGSATTSITWGGDVAAWSQRFRVYAVDMIGEPGLSAPSRPSLASEAHALWLDDVMAGLGVARASLVGMSLGGWLAFDYASRRPERVERLVMICPGGIGRNRNILIWVLPLLLLGPWGQRKVVERIYGKRPDEAPSPEEKALGDFLGMIFQHFRPRTTPLPVASDAALGRLTMPVMAVLGGKDVMIDSPGVRRRLEAHVPHARILWLADTGHVIVGQTGPILEFLT